MSSLRLSPTTHVRNGVATPLVAGAVALGVCTTLAFVNPSTSAITPPCPFHAITGLWCPGCGSTRALHALVHGDFASFVTYNPLLIVVLPMLFYAWLRSTRQWLRPSAKLWPHLSLTRSSGWAVAIALVAFAVLRNIPVDPFTALAPHAA